MLDLKDSPCMIDMLEACDLLRRGLADSKPACMDSFQELTGKIDHFEKVKIAANRHAKNSHTEAPLSSLLRKSILS